MYKKLKVIVFIALTALILMPASAQELWTPVSNQSTATATVFSTDVDRFINVNFWDTVGFEKWWGFGGSGIGNKNAAANGSGWNQQVNLGYATKTEKFYVGAAFAGNLFANYKEQTDTIQNIWDLDTQEITTTTVTKEYNTQDVLHINNNAAILIGMDNMGFKVGYYQNTYSYSEPARDKSIVSGNNGIFSSNGEQLEYSRFTGNINPWVQWGMKTAFNEKTLLPRAHFGIDFYRDNRIDNYRDYATFNGMLLGADAVTKEGRSLNYMTLQFGAGADYYINPTTRLILDYSGWYRLYDNDFSDSGFSGSANGTASWDGNSSNYDYFDRVTVSKRTDISISEYPAFHGHTITPRIRKEFTFEDLRLGLDLRAPIGFNFQTRENTSKNFNTSTTVYKDSYLSHLNSTTSTETVGVRSLYDETNFSISPQLGLGASYAFIPGKFTLNTGVMVVPVTYTTTSTKATPLTPYSTTYSVTETNGIVTNNSITTSPDGSASATLSETVTYTSTLTGLSGALGAGFVFSFTENVALDFCVNARTRDSSFNLDLTHVNLLLTLKF